MTESHIQAMHYCDASLVRTVSNPDPSALHTPKWWMGPSLMRLGSMGLGSIQTIHQTESIHMQTSIGSYRLL